MFTIWTQDNESFGLRESVDVCLCVNMCRQLSYVKKRCEGEPEGEGVAALTSEERTRWAKVRVVTFRETSGFEKTPHIQSIKKIKTSLFTSTAGQRASNKH